MNRNSAKLLGILAIILFIAIMPIVVFATNEDVSIVSTKNEEQKQEYIIYINGYTDKTFKYAFSNNQNPEEMDLVYINSITTNVDENQKSNQVAYLDASTYEKLSNQTIYMWAKGENEELILNGIELDFNNSLTKENINTIETITKRIKVEIADNEGATTTIRQENIDGVEETAAVGYVKITESGKAEYTYKRVKTTESEEYAKLMELAETIQQKYDEMDMYQKIQTSEEFYKLYSKAIEDNNNWEKVENKEIKQPEASVAGDKYIVFIKKVAGEETTIDAQFLTAFDDYKPNVIKEQKVTQETTKLPITYDSIALIVILAVIVIAIIVVFIRMKKLNNKDEEK